jgi:hypothetical protein
MAEHAIESIEAEWRCYREMVIPPAASDAQLVEMRRAFYAGAMIAFQAMVQCSRCGDTEREKEAAAHHLLTLKEQVEAFGRRGGQ